MEGEIVEEVGLTGEEWEESRGIPDSRWVGQMGGWMGGQTPLKYHERCAASRQ